MPTVLDSLVVEFNLDAANFTRQQQKIMDDLRKMTEQAQTRALDIESAAKKITNVFTSLQRGSIAVIGGFFGADILRTIDSFARMEANVSRVAQTIGMSRQETLAWSTAFKQLGYDANLGIGTLVQMGSQIQHGALTSDLSAPIFRVAQALGLNLLQGGTGVRGSMTGQEALMGLLQALDRRGIRNPQERAAYLREAGFSQEQVEIFERSARDMAAALDRARKNAPSEADIARQEQYVENVGKLDAAFTTLGLLITNQLTPVLEKLAGWLTTLVETFNPSDPSGAGGWSQYLGAGKVHDWLAQHLTPEGKALIGFDARAAENDAERAAFIEQQAKLLGLDPSVVSQVWTGEGRYGRGERRQSTIPGEQSFGDFQLWMGGGGLGARYQSETGRQPGDPRYWKEEDLWALRHMRFDPEGLKPWHAWKGDPHAGGAGMGKAPNQHVSFNIQNMNVNGNNAQQVADNIGKHVDRMTTAFFGNSAAV